MWLRAPLDDIAAHAGVGVGMVYRRFADRDALIDALFEQRIDDLAQLARNALEHPDPWEGFAGFVREATLLQASDRGLREALLRHGPGRERVDQARAKIGPLVGALVERAQRAGRLRADLGPFDVPLVPLMIGAVADATREVAPEVCERLIGIILDGMCSARAAPTPLAVGPLDADQFANVIARSAPGEPTR